VLYANIKQALRMQIGPAIEVIGAERVDIPSMCGHPAWFPTADEADQCAALCSFPSRHKYLRGINPRKDLSCFEAQITFRNF